MIVDKVKVTHVINTKPDFDTACRAASDLAIDIFGIDMNGHSDKINFIRSTDSVHTKFLSYEHTRSMGGHEYIYKFEVWIEREE